MGTKMDLPVTRESQDGEPDPAQECPHSGKENRRGILQGHFINRPTQAPDDDEKTNETNRSNLYFSQLAHLCYIKLKIFY